jgi:hypothetical protein
MVLEEFDRSMRGELARLVDLDPDLAVEDAARRVSHLGSKAGISGLDTRLLRLAEKMSRHGVLNPEWLEAQGLRVHFFLSNGRTGFLDQVVHDLDTNRDGVSQYILYGDWDSLIVLRGSEAEAETLHSSIRAGTDDEPVRFVASRVLVSYRKITEPISSSTRSVNIDVANRLVADYDAPELVSDRESLRASGHILGSAWAAGGQAPYPVMAYIGLLIRGRSKISPSEIRSALLANDTLLQTIVHLFQISEGIPFHYFVKLACKNMEELDRATNAIGLIKIGDVRFESRTLVVAAGTDRFPVVRAANISGIAVGPDFEGVMRAATSVYEILTQEERASFNAMNGSRQIAVIKALAFLQDKVSNRVWEPEVERRIRSAISTFSRESVTSSDDASFTGAVTEMTATVEGLTKRFLSRIGYGTYGRDRAKIQRELKLSTSKIRNVTLGKAVQALRIAEGHKDFGDYAEQLQERWIDRLERFANTRNSWAHDDIDLSGLELLDEAYRVLSEGLDLIQWLSASTQAVHSRSGDTDEGNDAGEGDDEGVRLRESRKGTLSVFISHASADSHIAARLAMGLKAFDYDTWFDDWELLPGDSIVEKIDGAIAATDVLLVLLSASSVMSKWVRRELSAGLAKQLSGQGVLIIPVLVEDCEIPTLLSETKYVDLRDHFEEGFRRLSDSLAVRRAKIAGQARDPEA